MRLLSVLSLNGLQKILGLDGANVVNTELQVLFSSHTAEHAHQVGAKIVPAEKIEQIARSIRQIDVKDNGGLHAGSIYVREVYQTTMTRPGDRRRMTSGEDDSSHP